MTEFCTGAGLIDCTPMMRAASGLVEIAPQFRTSAGLIDCGNGRALAAGITPAFVTGARSGPPQRIYTNAATVAPTGGRGAYTYAWGTMAGWQITSPTSATSTFSSIVGPGSDASEVFTCTVTDARGDSVAVTVTATVFNYGGGGGIIP